MSVAPEGDHMFAASWSSVVNSFATTYTLLSGRSRDYPQEGEPE